MAGDSSPLARTRPSSLGTSDQCPASSGYAAIRSQVQMGGHFSSQRETAFASAGSSTR